MTTLLLKIKNGLTTAYHILFSLYFLYVIVGVGAIIAALELIFGYKIIEPFAKILTVIALPAVIVIFIVMMVAMVYFTFIAPLIKKFKKK